MTDDYYVYLHIKETTGEPFYVGKGRANRAYYFRRRSTFWHSTAKKYGVDVVFLATNLDEDDALLQEEYWIKRIGRRNTKNGPLVNLTDGGETNKNRVFTDIHKQRLKEAGYKRLPPTDEARQNMSKAKEGLPSVRKGAVLSDDTKDKLRQHNLGKPNYKKRKIIIQYDLNNNFIREWNGAVEAITAGFSSKISCCANGKYKTINKYKWKWKTNNTKNDECGYYKIRITH